MWFRGRWTCRQSRRSYQTSGSSAWTKSLQTSASSSPTAPSTTPCRRRRRDWPVWGSLDTLSDASKNCISHHRRSRLRQNLPVMVLSGLSSRLNDCRTSLWTWSPRLPHYPSHSHPFRWHFWCILLPVTVLLTLLGSVDLRSDCQK